MPTLADITDPEGNLLIRQIPREDIQLLWHADFWDGPRSGMLIYEEQEYWFQVVAESEDDSTEWYRRFAVVRLTPNQHADQCRWHELFKTKVGVHTDYVEQQQRPAEGFLWPREHWHEFYDSYQQRTPPDYSSNEVLGWFEC